MYNIENLTHQQISRRILEIPAIIVPLGGLEPFGEFGVMGTETICVLEIVRELSRRCKILVAPAVPFGCSTPFISYAGAAGVKPRTFVNMLCDILHGYVFQGIERIFLVGAAPFNSNPVNEAAVRIKDKYPHVSVLYFDVNAILSGDNGNDKIDRNDALLLSLLMYLRPNMAMADATNADNRQIEQKYMDKVGYRTWKKRGMDPQKLRKLSPNGLFLSSDKNKEITPEYGKECFDRIVESIQQRVG